MCLSNKVGLMVLGEKKISCGTQSSDLIEQDRIMQFN